MDLLHLHLMLNHVPVVGVVGCVVLLIAALVARSRHLAIAGLLGIVTIALIGLSVFFTGEPAEERIEKIAGISERAIESHEEAAESAVIALEVAGAIALMGLIAFRVRHKLPVAAVTATVLVAIVAMTLLARTANLGGEIRHTELSGAAAVSGGEQDELDD